MGGFKLSSIAWIAGFIAIIAGMIAMFSSFIAPITSPMIPVTSSTTSSGNSGGVTMDQLEDPLLTEQSSNKDQSSKKDISGVAPSGGISEPITTAEGANVGTEQQLVRFLCEAVAGKDCDKISRLLGVPTGFLTPENLEQWITSNRLDFLGAASPVFNSTVLGDSAKVQVSGNGRKGTISLHREDNSWKFTAFPGIVLADFSCITGNVLANSVDLSSYFKESSGMYYTSGLNVPQVDINWVLTTPLGKFTGELNSSGQIIPIVSVDNAKYLESQIVEFCNEVVRLDYRNDSPDVYDAYTTTDYGRDSLRCEQGLEFQVLQLPVLQSGSVDIEAIHITGLDEFSALMQYVTVLDGQSYAGAAFMSFKFTNARIKLTALTVDNQYANPFQPRLGVVDISDGDSTVSKDTPPIFVRVD